MKRTRKIGNLLLATILFGAGFSAMPAHAEDPHAIPPHFLVDPANNHAWGHDWTPGVEATVTVEDVADAELLNVSTPVDEGGNWHLNFDDHGLDVQAGYRVAVDDLTTRVAHTVTLLQITEVDDEHDVLRGTAEALTEVEVHVYSHDDPVGRRVDVDEQGHWEANFGEPVGDGQGWDRAYPLTPGTEGSASQGWAYGHDEPFGATRVHWRVDLPYFRVILRSKDIQGHQWPVGAEMTVTIGDPADPVQVATTHVNPWGNWHLCREYLDGIPIAADTPVTVTDGETLVTHVVRNLDITNADFDGNTVSGTADPDSWVFVRISDRHVERHVRTTSAGEWVAEFGQPVGDGEYQNRAVALVPGDRVQANQDDHDTQPFGGTAARWRLAELDLTEVTSELLWLEYTLDGRAMGFGFEFEIDGDGILDAWLRTPEGVWHALTAEDEWRDHWILDREFDSAEALEAAFPTGAYRIWLRHMDGTLETDIRVGQHLEMPAVSPRITAPAFGASSVPAATATVEWEAVADPNFAAVLVFVNEFDEDVEDDEELFFAFLDDPGVTQMAIDGLEDNKIYDAVVAFANLDDGVTAEGLNFDIIRVSLEICPFSTNTEADRFAPLERVEIRKGIVAGADAPTALFQFEVLFDSDLQPAEGDPLFRSVWLLTPDFEDHQLFDAHRQEEFGDRLAFGLSGPDADALPGDGVYLLLLETQDGAVCSAFRFADPDTQAPLPLPAHAPSILEPALGALVASPFTIEWEAATDPAVNRVAVFADDAQDDPELLDGAATSLVAELPVGQYEGNVTFAHAHLELTNPDAVPLGVAKFHAAPLEYTVGYEITVAADPPTGGEVAGAGTYAAGEPVSVTATALPGHGFFNWTENGEVVSPQAGYSFPATANRDLTANFQAAVYTLTYLAGDGGAIDDPAPQVVAHGADGAPVEALPDAGDRFWMWSDGSTQNPRQDLGVSGDITVTALFAGMAPDQDVVITEARPNFAWRAVDGADWYQLSIQRDGQVYLTQWVEADAAWTPAEDKPFGQYEWRMRPWSAATGYGPWTPSASFSIPERRPADAPAQIAPLGDVTETRRPQFAWTAVEHATYYRVIVQRVGGSTVIDQWVRNESEWIPESGLATADYRWWVMGWGPDGAGPWSEEQTFTIIGQVPGMIALLAPDGAQMDHALDYRWAQDAHATWYQLWAGFERGGAWHSQWYESTPDVEQSARVAGHPEGEFVWWVRGWAPDGFGPWSGPLGFSTPSLASAPPVLTAPEGPLVHNPPAFRWQAAARTEWYRVYVQRGPDQVVDQWIQAQAGVNDYDWTPAAALPDGGYAWWVGAWNATSGRTVWSDRMDFRAP